MSDLDDLADLETNLASSKEGVNANRARAARKNLLAINPGTRIPRNLRTPRWKRQLTNYGTAKRRWHDAQS